MRVEADAAEPGSDAAANSTKHTSRPPARDKSIDIYDKNSEKKKKNMQYSVQDAFPGSFISEFRDSIGGQKTLITHRLEREDYTSTHAFGYMYHY